MNLMEKYNRIPQKYKNLFKFYVLRHDFNTNKIYNYNIFNNMWVSVLTYEALKTYLKDKDMEKFKESLHFAVKSELWSRSEYEIMVGGLFGHKDCAEKWDGYSQCQPNLDMFAEYLVMKLERKKKNGQEIHERLRISLQRNESIGS